MASWDKGFDLDIKLNYLKFSRSAFYLWVFRHSYIFNKALITQWVEKGFCHSTAFSGCSLKCYLQGEGELEAFTAHISTVDHYKLTHGGVRRVPGLVPCWVWRWVGSQPTWARTCFPTYTSHHRTSWVSSEPWNHGAENVLSRDEGR